MSFQVCNPWFARAYLYKYGSGSDQQQKVTFYETGAKNVLRVVPHELVNTKITSQRLLEEKKTLSSVREMAQTEMEWYNHRFPYVYLSVDLTRVPTTESGDRFVVLRLARNRKRFADEPPALKWRSELTDDERYFTETQVVHVKDHYASAVAQDKIALFSMRPPELFSVCSPGFYHKIFVGKSEKLVGKCSENVRESPWVDGLGRTVRIRYTHLGYLFEWLTNCSQEQASQRGRFSAEVSTTCDCPRHT